MLVFCLDHKQRRIKIYLITYIHAQNFRYLQKLVPTLLKLLQQTLN